MRVQLTKMLTLTSFSCNNIRLKSCIPPLKSKGHWSILSVKSVSTSDAIKQNESEVGKNIILVTEVSFQLNTCKCQC